MEKWCKRWVMAIVISFQLFSSVTKAAELRDFLMSCAYGTAAGALVGLATLAFSEDPSKNFSNVAKGASLGLYAGIGMGLYMIYGDGSSLGTTAMNYSTQDTLKQMSAPKLALIPEWKDSKVDGLRLQVQIAQF
jgi:hypothetical protein